MKYQFKFQLAFLSLILLQIMTSSFSVNYAAERVERPAVSKKVDKKTTQKLERLERQKFRLERRLKKTKHQKRRKVLHQKIRKLEQEKQQHESHTPNRWLGLLGFMFSIIGFLLLGGLIALSGFAAFSLITLAIFSLFSAFIGFGLSILSFVKMGGESLEGNKKGFAIAGLIISGFVIAVFLASLILTIVLI